MLVSYHLETMCRYLARDDAFIRFDHSGVCNYCTNYKLRGIIHETKTSLLENLSHTET